jgi:hypothetical protein
VGFLVFQSLLKAGLFCVERRQYLVSTSRCRFASLPCVACRFCVRLCMSSLNLSTVSWSAIRFASTSLISCSYCLLRSASYPSASSKSSRRDAFCFSDSLSRFSRLALSLTAWFCKSCSSCVRASYLRAAFLEALSAAWARLKSASALICISRSSFSC